MVSEPRNGPFAKNADVQIWYYSWCVAGSWHFNGGRKFVFLSDIAGAFDRVEIVNLLAKLRRLGICAKLITFF